MDKGLVVVGKCRRSMQRRSTFRFRGVYRGERISQITVNLWGNCDLIEGRDYILFLKFIRIDRANLVTSLVKYKDIS